MENILEYIIPIIIILAYLFPKARKKKAKEVSATPPKKKKSRFNLLSKLNKMMEEYYQADSPKPGGRSTRRDPFEIGDEPYKVVTQSEHDDDDSATEESEEREPSTVTSPWAKHVQPQSKTVAEVVADPLERRRSPQESQVKNEKVEIKAPEQGYLRTKLTARELRKAIVWKEILGPPVALREED